MLIPRSERILQYLASEGMVDEVREDQFTATSISRALSLPGFKAGLNHQSVSRLLVKRYLLIFPFLKSGHASSVLADPPEVFGRQQV